MSPSSNRYGGTECSAFQRNNNFQSALTMEHSTICMEVWFFAIRRQLALERTVLADTVNYRKHKNSVSTLQQAVRIRE